MVHRRNAAKAARAAREENTRADPVFGNNRAESDAMLARVFVRTADFEALAAGPNHNFVIGRRGAGKSALFLELTKEFTTRDELLVSFVPEESTVKGLVAALRERLSPEPKYTNVRSLMRVVWRAALLAVVGRILGKRNRAAEAYERATELPWLASDLLASVLAIVEALPAGGDADALVYKAASHTGLDKLTDLVRADLDASYPFGQPRLTRGAAVAYNA